MKDDNALVALGCVVATVAVMVLAAFGSAAGWLLHLITESLLEQDLPLWPFVVLAFTLPLLFVPRKRNYDL